MRVYTVEVSSQIEVHTIRFQDLIGLFVYCLQDKQEKQFIFRHSRSVFELLDADGSNIVSAEEFESFGFLFNFEGRAVRQIFREFDVSGDQV